MKGLDDPLQLVGDRRAVEPGDVTGERVGDLFRGVADRIEGLPDQDIPGERGGQKDEDEDGDELVSQNVVFKTEVEKTQQRHEEKKGEDDGQTNVEPSLLQGKLNHFFLTSISCLLAARIIFACYDSRFSRIITDNL